MAHILVTGGAGFIGSHVAEELISAGHQVWVLDDLSGSVNLINLSVLHGVKCFVFTSSIAVYGKNQLPMSETMRPEPEDSYGIAKLAVEQILLYFFTRTDSTLRS